MRRIHPHLFVFLLTAAAFTLPLAGCKSKVPKDRPHWNGEYISVEATDEDAERAFPPAYKDHFHQIDGKVENGIYEPLELSGLEIKGRNAWMLWTGGNEIFWDWLAGNGYGSIDLLKVIDSDKVGGRFARSGFITEPGMRAPTDQETEESYGVRFARPKTDYYKDASYQDSAPDPKVYGYPTGIVGMRVFKNPEFVKSKVAQRKWKDGMGNPGEPHRFYSDSEADKAWASNPKTIKPYVVGVSCAICHASFHPLNPPTDVENPEWNNISSTVGAQYLRIRDIFGNALEPDNYLYHVIDSQLPGTIDTSLIATDQINNANTMNAIYGLASRVVRALYNPAEKMSEASFGPKDNRYPGVWDKTVVYSGDYNYPPLITDFYEEFEGNPRHVPMVLIDGSDSVGTWIALARVYLNIGTYHQQWTRTHNTILGFKKQTPFTLKDCEENSVYWHATKIRVDPVTAYFLKSTDPMKLKDALVNNEPVKKFPPTKGMTEFKSKPENKDHVFNGLPSDPSLSKARQVFAKGCIACHSSKQPDFAGLTVKDGNQTLNPDTLDLDDLWQLTRGNGELPEEYAKWAMKVVEDPGYWKDNYLSTDMRIPINMVGTNSARSMATNAKTGEVWEDFASLKFKDLPAVKDIRYPDPFSGATKSYDGTQGGPGYYRVPSLISIWSTAPFLHNNSLGKFTNDPSIKGRLESFDDAIAKLLWPEKRLESVHDLAKLDRQETRSAEQLKKDGGLVWRTSQTTHFKIRGHQIPSLIQGMTGFTWFWVRLIPWIPSLGFLFFGLVILFGQHIKATLKNRAAWLVKILKWLRDSVASLRTPIGLILVGVWIAGVVVWWIYLKPVLRLVEIGSGWSLPWINLQLVFGFLISALVVTWFIYPKIYQHRWTVVIFLLAFIVFGLGLGRFGSGQGGDIAVGPFPKGMPVNLVVNMNRKAPPKKLLKAVVALTTHFVKHANSENTDAVLLDFEENVAPLMQDVSSCPDLVMDRGHDFQFIQQLTDDEKKELIQLIKTF